MAALTDNIDNFPTSPKDGTTGTELTQKILSQALNAGTKQVQNNINKIEKENNIFIIHADYSPHIYKAYSIVIASGCEPKKLGLPGEDKYLGKGISYCAVCDGPFFKEKDIAVIGGGNSALKEAIFLTRFANKVYVIHRRDEFRATKDVQEKVLKNERIILLKSSIAKEIQGHTHVEKLIIEDIKINKTSELNVSGIFFYVGFTPNLGFAKNLNLKCDEEGYIITDEEMATNIQGIYAAGDIRYKPLKQVITACSDGAIATYSSNKYIEKLKVS